ncbi:hypothetical protein [Sphingobium estronivorans]|uniref:hypothetical protein n=1 Tax=Sphingobium estronivorans TaxID=1577690 RepID=UPI001F07E66A|nr:hypothetical protein [Sphingobium estronivorans]
MKGQRSKSSATHPCPTWHRVIWTFTMAVATYGIYLLHRHRIMTEEQLMLAIFIIVPVSAFLLSGQGQDRSDDWDAVRKDKSGNT